MILKWNMFSFVTSHPDDLFPIALDSPWTGCPGVFKDKPIGSNDQPPWNAIDIRAGALPLRMCQYNKTGRIIIFTYDALLLQQLRYPFLGIYEAV